MSNVQSWVGLSEQAKDRVSEGHLAQYQATFDRAYDGTAPCPQSIHWTLCPPAAQTAKLRADGHLAPEAGGLIPPGAPPRRMWASSKLSFHAPIHLGAAIERRSSIRTVSQKEGRTGPLIFVDIAHEWMSDTALAVSEVQTVVYRQPESQKASAPVAFTAFAADADLDRVIVPNEALLFRYSALTFNSHRIHYDRNYAMREEGYDDLVVQGPLTASLLIDLVSQRFGHNAIRTFEFRGVSPAFANQPLRLAGRCEGRNIHLTAEAQDRQVMSARATLFDL
jgi:3-methylfumaryl-CoA hydratase